MDDQQSLNQDGNAEEAQGSLGVEPEQVQDSTNESDAGSLATEDDPKSVKKRLGQQAKKHQREMRAVKDQLSQLQAQIGQPQAPNNSQQMNPYANQPNTQGMSIEEQIQRGVNYALQAREEQERKAKEAQQMQHVHKQYQRLNDDFDKASDKYEDFDDVVRGDAAPFTATMRDALLLVDNPADVAYKLGKSKDELHRISQLHPLDQAREVNKLSFALMNGNGKASTAPGNNGARPMGNIRVNPANSQAVTGNTPPSVIRARMKAGTWK